MALYDIFGGQRRTRATCRTCAVGQIVSVIKGRVVGSAFAGGRGRRWGLARVGCCLIYAKRRPLSIEPRLAGGGSREGRCIVSGGCVFAESGRRYGRRVLR